MAGSGWPQRLVVVFCIRRPVPDCGKLQSAIWAFIRYLFFANHPLNVGRSSLVRRFRSAWAVQESLHMTEEAFQDYYPDELSHCYAAD
jgi:hypothetical protein